MKVLIAYDGSVCAKSAVQDLKRAGLPDRVEALAVSVADVFIPPGGFDQVPVPATAPMVLTKSKESALAVLERSKVLAEEVGKMLRALFPHWDVKADSFADSPAWGIIKKAQEWKANLIVVGAHGLSVTGRLIFGSVAQMVATHAPCSVRVVHGKSEDAESPPRLVAGMDGSSFAQKAVNEVASRHWKKGTAVHLITVLEPRLTSLLAIELEMRKWLRDTDKTEFEAMKRFMEAEAEKLRAKGLAVTHLAKEGDPKKILLEEAEHWGANCIFVGARGLSGIKHFLIGSVSASLAARAHCTVEIVRA